MVQGSIDGFCMAGNMIVLSAVFFNLDLLTLSKDLRVF